jgi:hypothetical protein
MGLHARLSAAVEAKLLTIHLALQSAMPSPGGEDYKGMGIAMVPFSLSLFYEGHMASLPTDPFTTYIWDSRALPRCKHFLWLAHQDRLPTAALLYYCGQTESQHHLLLKCPLATMVWNAAD